MGEGTNSRADRQEPSWSLVGWPCPPHPKPYPLSLQHFRWYLCGSLCGMKDGTVLSTVPGTKIDGLWLLCFWDVNNGISLSSMKQRMNWLEASGSSENFWEGWICWRAGGQKWLQATHELVSEAALRPPCLGTESKTGKGDVGPWISELPPPLFPETEASVTGCCGKWVYAPVFSPCSLLNQILPGRVWRAESGSGTLTFPQGGWENKGEKGVICLRLTLSAGTMSSLPANLLETGCSPVA